VFFVVNEPISYNKYIKHYFKPGDKWLMPVILATWEAEMRRIKFQS
jgi:hypothetical protein